MTSLLEHPTIAAIVHALAWSLLHFLWQGCTIACIYAGASYIARRGPAQARYLIGCAALALLTLAPIATFAVIAQTTSTPPTTLASTHHLREATAAVAPTISSTSLAIVIAWLAGALICTLWLTGGLLQSHLVRRLPYTDLPARTRVLVEQLASAMHVRASVRVVGSACATIPMTIGWIAPIILLPVTTLAGLSTAQLTAIIAHELAHVKRYDYLVNVLQRVLESLLFYHPAVWWVSSRVRQEREYCCDDIAVAVCGDHVLYAQALAELEALRAPAVQLALSSQGGSLMKRITRLLKIPCPARPNRARPFIALAALALVAGTSAAFALARPSSDETNKTIEVDPASEGESTEPTEWLFEASDQQSDEAKIILHKQLMQLKNAQEEYEVDLRDMPFPTQPDDVAFGEFEAHDNEFVECDEAGMLLECVVVLEAEPIDPIMAIAEAKRLRYPWDIFDIVLGVDDATKREIKLQHANAMVRLHLEKQLHEGGDLHFNGNVKVIPELELLDADTNEMIIILDKDAASDDAALVRKKKIQAEYKRKLRAEKEAHYATKEAP